MNDIVDMTTEIHIVFDATGQSISFVQNGIKLDAAYVFSLLHSGLWTIFYKKEHIECAVDPDGSLSRWSDTPKPVYQKRESIRIIPVY